MDTTTITQEPLYITESKQMCIELGMDPKRLPSFANVLSEKVLRQKKAEYEEVLEVVNFFVQKTLDLMKGFPILIVITDENASVLEMAGDETIKSTVNALGIREGLQFEEEVTGTNSVTLALKQRHAVGLVGQNHFHEFLHTSACYSAPFQYSDVEQMLGTIGIMTAKELHHPTLLTMLCNLTDSIERELLLRKQNRRLHILNQIMIDSTRNGIIVTDREGNIVEFNEYAQLLTGLSKNEVLTKTIGAIAQMGGYFVEGEFRAMGSFIREVLDNGKKFEDIEMIFESTNNRGRRICLFDSLPIYDENQVLIGAYGQFRDITDSYEAREQAEKANKAKSQFLSSMSHELRTPLNAILGFAQLLENDDLSPEQLEDTREILKAGSHLLDLINDILDLSRIETNKIQVTVSPVNVNLLLDECVTLVEPIALEKNIRLSWKPTAVDIFVNADRTRLKQAFINLLSNAIKYNVDHGNVDVSIETIGRTKLKVNVQDTGYGIPEADIRAIFQPFRRLPQHSGIDGTGIGLTITQQLVELMGGNIGVQSVVGKGSRFWIELNMSDNNTFNESDVFTSEQEDEPEADQKIYNILYVEDNPANLLLVNRIFKRFPHIRLISAPNAYEGIESALKHVPDLILMDINLPGLSGFEAFEQLQGMKEVRHIPIVAISANAMPADINRGIELGFKGYITKPINVQGLMETIYQMLGISQNDIDSGRYA